MTVAVILKPQGIRGELKVKAMTDTSEDLAAFKKVIIDGEEYSVLSLRAQGGYAYINLKGCADRDSAEFFRGKEIEVARADMPELPEGRYYITDLIGCEVVNERGETLGTVTDVTPAKTDIFTILRGEKSIMFPAADGVITDVDAEGGKITVNGKRFKEVSL